MDFEAAANRIAGQYGMRQATGAPQQPGPSPRSEPTTPFNPGPGIKYGGATVGATSQVRGWGKYIRPANNPFNRNVNGNQFLSRINKGAVMGAVKSGIEAWDDAKFFRTHGVMASTRHVLGMPQVASHHNDQINARRNAQNRNPGINPSPAWMEDAGSFNLRHHRTEEEYYEPEHWGP